MASYHGNDGVVKVGANAVGEVESFTLDISADTVEVSTMGSMAKKFKPSKTSWSGSVDVLYDPDDTTGQQAMVIGTAIALSLSPQGGETTGEVVFDGSAIITGASVTTPHDDVVKRSFTFQGTDALTETATA